MKKFTLSAPQPRRDLKIDYAEELNTQQLDVVQNGNGPCLVLAGAGSGKTRTITYRVAYLLEAGVDPSEILLLTFTNKAAKEMTSRVEMLLGSYPQGLWAGTFHSVANRLLRKYANKVGYQPNFSILDQEDAKELVSLCVKDLKIDTKGKRFPSSSVLHSIISYKSNKSCTLEAVLEAKHPKFLPILSEIEEVELLYHRQKKEQNAMDFDDLLLKLLKLLSEHREIEVALCEQFRFILVDEFQDTNVVQAEIVHRIAKGYQNLLVVGDDAQSIYSFRAAEIQNILSFPNQYQNTKTYKLTKNYRSTSEILSTANVVIENNKDQFKKDLEAIVSSGEKPCVVPARHTTQEARYIADQLLEIHHAGTPLCEIAVLFRAAFHSQSLEFELMKRDIPYEYRGGMKFFERAHIKDAVSHLRILYNVKDGMAWVRALKIHPGIGLMTANKIANQCAAIGDVDRVKEAEIRGKKAQIGWSGFLRIWRDILATKRRPADMIRAFVASDDYRLYLENEYPNYRDRLDDLEQFAIFAEQFDELADFLEAVSLTNEYGAVRETESDEETDKLILSTIHQAKGLEWDHVFVMNLVEGGFPHNRAFEEHRGLEEERRLFYVAVTRAKRQLFLTYPTTAGYEILEIKQPSIFLDEIPDSAVELVRLKKSLVKNSFQSPSSFKGGIGGSSGSGNTFNDGYEEPAIILDETGEQVKKEVPSSFLRNIDEL